MPNEPTNSRRPLRNGEAANGRKEDDSQYRQPRIPQQHRGRSAGRPQMQDLQSLATDATRGRAAVLTQTSKDNSKFLRAKAQDQEREKNGRFTKKRPASAAPSGTSTRPAQPVPQSTLVATSTHLQPVDRLRPSSLHRPSTATTTSAVQSSLASSSSASSILRTSARRPSIIVPLTTPVTALTAPSVSSMLPTYHAASVAVSSASSSSRSAAPSAPSVVTTRRALLEASSSASSASATVPPPAPSRRDPLGVSTIQRQSTRAQTQSTLGTNHRSAATSSHRSLTASTAGTSTTASTSKSNGQKRGRQDDGDEPPLDPKIIRLLMAEADRGYKKMKAEEQRQNSTNSTGGASNQSGQIAPRRQTQADQRASFQTAVNAYLRSKARDSANAPAMTDFIDPNVPSTSSGRSRQHAPARAAIKRRANSSSESSRSPSPRGRGPAAPRSNDRLFSSPSTSPRRGNMAGIRSTAASRKESAASSSISSRPSRPTTRPVRPTAPSVPLHGTTQLVRDRNTFERIAKVLPKDPTVMPTERYSFQKRHGLYYKGRKYRLKNEGAKNRQAVKRRVETIFAGDNQTLSMLEATREKILLKNSFLEIDFVAGSIDPGVEWASDKVDTLLLIVFVGASRGEWVRCTSADALEHPKIFAYFELQIQLDKFAIFFEEECRDRGLDADLYGHRYLPEPSENEIYGMSDLARQRTLLAARQEDVNEENEFDGLPPIYILDWMNDIFKFEKSSIYRFRFVNHTPLSARVEKALASGKIVGFKAMCTAKCGGCQEGKGEEDKGCDKKGKKGDEEVQCSCRHTCNSEVECTADCRCDKKTCKRRTVQNGRQTPLVVMRHHVKGWTTRVVVDRVERGDYCFEYIAELVTYAENLRKPQTYAMEQSDGMLERDRKTSCTMAEMTRRCQKYGTKIKRGYVHRVLVANGLDFSNEIRFASHACEPNMRVETTYVDRRSYALHRLAFYAQEVLVCGQEYSWNYFGEDLEKAMKNKNKEGFSTHLMERCDCLHEFCAIERAHKYMEEQEKEAAKKGEKKKTAPKKKVEDAYDSFDEEAEEDKENKKNKKSKKAGGSGKRQ